MVSVEGPYTKIPGYARQLRRTVYKRYIYKKTTTAGMVRTLKHAVVCIHASVL